MPEIREHPTETTIARHFQGRLKAPGEPIGLPGESKGKSRNLAFSPEQMEQMRNKKFLEILFGKDERWTFAIKGRRNGNLLLQRLFPDSPEMEKIESQPEKVFTLKNP